MPNDPNFLDVEDDEQRQSRIGTLLERLNATSPAFPSASDPSTSLLNVDRNRAPGPIEPPTELLARVQAFLPAMHASNEALAQANPHEIDIENLAKDEEQYIEMNLGLGVFEAKRRHKNGPPSSSSEESNSSSTSSSESSESSSEEDSDSSSSSDDSDSSDEDEDSQSGPSIDMQPVSSRPLKPLPRRVSQQTRGKVDVLSLHLESTTDADVT